MSLFIRRSAKFSKEFNADSIIAKSFPFLISSRNFAVVVDSVCCGICRHRLLSSWLSCDCCGSTGGANGFCIRCSCLLTASLILASSAALFAALVSADFWPLVRKSTTVESASPGSNFRLFYYLSSRWGPFPCSMAIVAVLAMIMSPTGTFFP